MTQLSAASTPTLYLLLLCCCGVCAFLAPHCPFSRQPTMSLASPDNPFGEFALGASPSASSSSSSSLVVGRVRSSHNAPSMDSVDSKVPKKRRAPTCSAGSPKKPKGLVEKYRSPGEPEWPLRVIIVGHNPSEKAWEVGHYYGNPSNRMWKLLSSAGIVPPGFTASDDDICPITSGVGFTDVGFSIPGTISSEFGKRELHCWRQGFYDRLAAHAERAAGTLASATSAEADARIAASSTTEAIANKTVAVVEGPQEISAVDVEVEDGYPKIVAFAGKRQWEELFFDASKEVKAQTKGGKKGAFRFGKQPAALRPPGWPFPAGRTEMFVLPSSSGAAAMTNESREAPYRELGDYISRPGQEWTRRRRNGD